MRGVLNSTSAALLLCCGLQFGGTTAIAATCDGSSNACSIDLGRATANFAIGQASYAVEAFLVDGSDASFGGHAQPLASFQPTHAAGSDGLLVQPQIYAYVGGSGIQGLHEAAATLLFRGLSFSADAGYEITGVQAVIKGSYALAGNAYGQLNVPGAFQWDGQNFTASFALDPAAADFYVSLDVAASYVEGEDGTALSYGAGSASFDSLEFIVNVSPVPEPAPALLLAAGAALLPWLAKRRRRA